MRNAVGAVDSVLVLGATSDLADAILDRLVQGGARTLTLAARRPADLERRAGDLRAAGCRVRCLEFDAARPEDHEAVAAEAFADGDVDLVLVAFGVLADGTLEAGAALDVAAVNYAGAVSIQLRVLEHLRRQGHGTVVVLSSVAAWLVRASNVVYASTKAGLDTFALGLGDAVAGDAIHVMTVRPGFVRTKMTAGRPAPPLLATDPAAVADAVVRGLERGARVVWVPAAMRWVTLALRALPRPLFRRLPL